MRRFGRIGFVAVVGVMLTWGVGRAYITKYQQKREAILAACKAARDKMSPEQQKAAAKCPTPEITLVTPATAGPGDTVEVTVPGKFPAGTSFIFESDSVEVLKESSNANSYRATIRILPGGGPEILSVVAYVPICCKAAARSNAITITGRFEWELKASNGWIVMARPQPAEGKEMPYLLEFFRAGEKTPFAKRRANLNPSRSETPSYYFSISDEDEASMKANEEMASISKRMQNPDISDDERDKLMQRLQEIIENMTKDVAKMSDPNYMKQLQQKRDEFGCTAINLKLENGAATGSMTCGQKVGRDLKVTGTMKYLGK